MSEELKKEIVSQIKNQVEKILTDSDNDKNLKHLIYSGIENNYLIDINSKQNAVEEFFKINKIELHDLTIKLEDDIKLFDRLYMIFFKNCKFNISKLPFDNKETWFKECHFNEQFEPSNYKQYGLIGTIFNECHFHKGIDFGYEKVYDSNLFSDCTIYSKMLASKCIFNGKLFWNTVDNPYKNINELHMVSCKFNGDFIINEINREKKSEFVIDKLNLRDSTFNSKVKLFKCKINKATFYNTKFKDLADFYESEFIGLYIDTLMERGLDYLEVFEKTDFEGITVFSKSIFNCDINFKYTKFLDHTIFRETIVNKKFDLKDAIIKGEINFLNINNGIEINISNRETARIIKDSFEQQNNIIEANKFYALEMKEMEKELEEKRKVGKSIFQWLVFKVHGLTSNYSQDWTLAFFWIINLTFVYSYLKVTINDIWEIQSLLKILFSFIIIFVIGCMTIKIPENYDKRWLTTVPTTIVFYVIYGVLIEKDWTLSQFSKNLNPFSIMNGEDSITFGTLIFKVAIAYLIYQLIISIRQNTRRK